jgi:uncharacterized protein (UPF0332 family)
VEEVEFARETLRFSQMFTQMGVTNPWLYRMLLGRLYYAAHHLGRRLLIEVGLRPDQWRASVHQRVLNDLHQHYVATGRMTVIDFEISHSGKTARVRSAWIVRNDENFPRLVTCYVL